MIYKNIFEKSQFGEKIHETFTVSFSSKGGPVKLKCLGATGSPRPYLIAFHRGSIKKD
jgi:hypothetical protein